MRIKAKRMSKNSKKTYLIVGAVVILMALVATGVFAMKHLSNKPDVENKEEKKNDEVNHDKIDNSKPVSGDKKDSNSRPFAVMINNISTARPYQSGLQDAYIVYELIAEGGITRFLALFKDMETARIGTVRSARHYYLDYVLENDAYFVHWGWSPQAQSDISSLKIDNINGLHYSNKYFWTDTSLKVSTEHTRFTSMEKLEKAVKDLGYRTTSNKDMLLNYSEDSLDLEQVKNAKKCNALDIKYSNSTTTNYQYDSEKKVYFRSVNNKAHVDYVSKEQYNFKNIIVYQVKNTSIDKDDKGRQELNNIGVGNGYYISEGYAIPIKWEKKSRSAETKYTLENGEELVVNEGNTFIQIQPKGLSLDIK